MTTAWSSFFASSATLFGVGKIRPAPGTWGTLVAVPFAYLLMRLDPLFFMGFTLVSVFVGIFVCEIHEKVRGSHDASEVVIDEFVGYLITVMWLPPTWQSLVAGFVIFRVLDIWKPLFIGQLDAKVHGGLGTMVDDIAAALVGNLLLQIIYYKTSLLGWQWMGGLV